MEFIFETEMAVRDYECDLQGIVNNAVYQNYLEHARHEFLHEIGLDFDRLCRDGIDAVVTRIEMDYKAALRPRDRFVVKLAVRKEGRLRIVFDQVICRREEDQLVLQAQVYAVLTRNGRPIAPALFDSVLSSGEGSGEP